MDPQQVGEAESNLFRLKSLIRSYDDVGHENRARDQARPDCTFETENILH